MPRQKGQKRKLKMAKGYKTDKAYIPAGERKLKLLILAPNDKNARRTGVLWIHGGGYVTGMAGMVHTGKKSRQKVRRGCHFPRIPSCRKSAIPRRA